MHFVVALLNAKDRETTPKYRESFPKVSFSDICFNGVYYNEIWQQDFSSLSQLRSNCFDAPPQLTCPPVTGGKFRPWLSTTNENP